MEKKKIERREIEGH